MPKDDTKNFNYEKELESERSKLEKLVLQETAIGVKIKASRQRIKELSLMNDSQKLNQLSEALDKAGFSFDDILAMLANGEDLEQLAQKINEPASESPHREVI